MAMRAGDLDRPLLRLTDVDYFSVRDACQGVAIMGGIGSGKTSGSGAALAQAYLKAGFGGLVLCAKPEEAELWRGYCAATGRTRHLLEWDGTNFSFNFIAYELARQGEAGLNSVVECIMRVLEICKNASPMPTRPGEPFFDDTTRQILRNTVLVLYKATGTVRIADILRYARSAPTSAQEMHDPKWQETSFFYQCWTAAAPYLSDEQGARILGYWLSDFAMLDPKTRGNIIISLTTALDRFNHGWLKDAFCGETNILPELTLNGQVILLNMPALTMNEDGIIAQQLFKYIWQRAVLTRNGLPPQYRERPVFLWADEAQYFVNSFDAEYLSTCRGSRACTVFLSQSLPTYYAKMGGDGSAHDRVHHLLGNFATKIWHNLGGCTETGEWAAKTLGRTLHARQNWSAGEGTSQNFGMNMGEGNSWGTSSSAGGHTSHGSGGSSSGSSWSSGSTSGSNNNRGRNRGRGTSINNSHGASEQMDYILEPGAFSSRLLKTGGPANDNRVSAVWFQAGKQFRASGGNALLLEFAQ